MSRVQARVIDPPTADRGVRRTAGVRFAVSVLAMISCLAAAAAQAQISTLIESPRATNTAAQVATFEMLNTDTRKWAAYRGYTYAVMGRSAGVLVARVETGDPLPAPLLGSFNTFEYPVVNDNNDVVFLATLNSTSQEAGYFMQTAAGALVHIDGGLANNARDAADINAGRDVVWINARPQEIYFYDDSAGTNTLIAERDGTTVPGGGDVWGRFGERPAISNGGTVAFVAELRQSNDKGIYLWDPATAAFTEVARDGAATPVTGVFYDRFSLDQPIGIDDAGRVVFVASVTGTTQGNGAFLFDPSTGTTSVVAKEGEAVLGGPAGAVVAELSDELVAIDDLGRIAIFADIDPGIFSDDRVILRTAVAGTGQLDVHSPSLSFAEQFSPRLTNSTAAVPTSTILIEGGGTTDGVKTLAAGPALQTVLNMFTVTPLGRDVEYFQPSIGRNGDLVFLGRHRKLYVDNFTATNALGVHEPGLPSPSGGGLITQRLAEHIMERRFVAFVALDDGVPLGPIGFARGIGIFNRKQPGVVVRVAATGDPAPAAIGGLLILGNNSNLIGVKGRRVLFDTDILGGAVGEAIFAVRPGQPLRTILAAGVPTPVGPFSSIRGDRAMLVGRWLVFEGVTGPANDISLSIMKWNRPSTLRTLVKEGDPFPTGSGVVEHIGEFVVNRRGDLLYAAISDLNETGIFLRDSAGVTVTVVLNEAAVPPSVDPTATFDFDDAPDLALARNGNAFFTTLFENTTNPIGDGLFHFDGVALTELALSNATAAPGAGAFSGIASFGPLSVNQNAVVGRFRAELSGYSEAVMRLPY